MKTVIDIPGLGETPVLKTSAHGIEVITDRIEYRGIDQVFPLHPENEMFLEEPQDWAGKSVLDIGLGSAILSVGAVRLWGAAEAVGLEINSRAIAFARYNISAHGLEDRIGIAPGDRADLWAPVRGRRFDRIISNPPFEPTPRGCEYYLHSAAGLYGTTVLERILAGLDEHLTEDGAARIVAAVPIEFPYRSDNLTAMVGKHLSGDTRVRMNAFPMSFHGFTRRFVRCGFASEEQYDELQFYARRAGISGLQLCVIDYTKGQKRLSYTHALKNYPDWDLPLEGLKPMGCG